MAKRITGAARAHYEEPVARLLRIGEGVGLGSEWPDYPKRYGLAREHAGDLLHMACDRALIAAEDDPEKVWAPTHAARALGQLQAVEALAPLLELQAQLEPDDMVALELIDVIAAMGPPAIPHLDTFISAVTDDDDDMAMASAVEGLSRIGDGGPELRARCVEILTRRISDPQRVEPAVNGQAIYELTLLKAVESIDAIRDAFDRDAVDTHTSGPLERIEYAFGLRDEAPPSELEIALSRRADLDEDPKPSVPAQPEPVYVAPRSSPKIGRNEPCPCGSGKKYKKCCGDSSRVA